MGFGELLLLSLGVSMDAFAVSVCKGLCVKKATIKESAICGIWFGGFQALMPLLGFFLGTLFAAAIQKVDHWVAFGLLTVIGISMLKEAFEKEEVVCDVNSTDFSFKTMFVMAVATSIDALAVGVTLAMTENVNIYLAVLLIGAFTFLMSAVGVKIGNVFGSRYEKPSQITGGGLLILWGLGILMKYILAL